MTALMVRLEDKVLSEATAWESSGHLSEGGVTEKSSQAAVLAIILAE